MNTYVCDACGAKIIVNSDQHFTECLYCGNTISILEDKTYDLNIRKMIPFSIDKKDAISKFKKLIGKEVEDAKKIYVPVIFASYHYTYLLYYEYETVYRDQDGCERTSYHDNEILYEGDAFREAIFGSSKVKQVSLSSEYSNLPTIDFDPALLDDVSIEYASFDDEKQLVENAEKKVTNYAYNQIKECYTITNIYTQNVFLSDFNIDNYTTLVPVYVMSTIDGKLYNIPGVALNKADKKIKNNNKGILISSITTLCLFIYMVINIYSMVAIYVFGISLAIFLYFLLCRANIRSHILSESYDNFSCKAYNFTPKKKRK